MLWHQQIVAAQRGLGHFKTHKQLAKAVEPRVRSLTTQRREKRCSLASYPSNPLLLAIFSCGADGDVSGRCQPRPDLRRQILARKRFFALLPFWRALVQLETGGFAVMVGMFYLRDIL